MPICLVPIESTGKRIVLEKAIVFFGRHPECDVILTRSRKVSRKHCCIAQVNNRLVVRDLGSMKGVRVNRQRIDREARVRVGDELAIGDVCYHVEEVAAAPRRGVVGAMAGAGVSSGSQSARSQGPPQIDPAQVSSDVPVVVSDDGNGDFGVEEPIPAHDDDGVLPAEPDEAISLDDSEIM